MALNPVGAFSRMSPALSAAYSSLSQPASQRFSQWTDNPRGRSLNLPAAQRKSAAVQDLAMQGTEDLTAQAVEEQRRKKQIELNAQRSGMMSAAWLSLSGNQF